MHPINIEKFKCDVPGCEQEFLTKQARTKHKKTDHGIDVPKPFCCPYEKGANTDRTDGIRI